MKIRGERECRACGTRWSYYETGSVVCPDCGSIRSVGLDDPTEHTAGNARLDLTEIRALLDDQPLADVAEAAAERCREYVRQCGFVSGGELRPLDDTYLGAAELRLAGEEVARAMHLTDDEEYYFLDLLRGADAGERPPADEVPESMRAVRGLAYARAVDAYRSDLRRYLEDNPDATVRSLLTTLRDHQKRIEALDGDVSARTAGELVYVVRAVGRALADDDETALAEAQRRLDGFEIDL
ncbi:TFIIB-type zinc ribbon-containing protein [Halosimplex litoreum]|uniref:TFIIB-type zinc ribbon-containing protein n=1 Tax=Halosimplex litoreum TaxID=1198301 RepID=A0A7T3KUQ7_9EURY|nr:TFIIB-type zinc ribbon-containing protein [Halosimplex litoreum]QPV62549.1 TFIIB-type zinc ribbon-containing protein [Halosimplex litoreum]